MIVDQDNFSEAYIKIKEIIEQKPCSFVAMDLEMTGIKSYEPEYKDDFPFERFAKMRKVAQRFNIIQVGLSIFTLENGEYTAYPFNFYVFPKENQIYTPTIQLQCGAIEFNCKHNMDFNRWIYKGIPYIQNDHKQKLDDLYLKQQDDIKQLQDDITYHSNRFNKDTFEKTQQEQEQVKKWVQNDQRENKTYTLNDVNWFQKKYYNAYFTVNYPNLIVDMAEKSITLTLVDQEQKELHLKKQRAEKQNKIDEIYGFTRIMQLIWENKLPTVGHNCLFDHLFIHQAFYGNIPLSYNQFKQNLNKMYGDVYDTKRFAALALQNFSISSTLENLKDFILSNPDKFAAPKIQLAEGYQKYDWNNEENKQSFHEAGFDSYLTGWVFIQLKQKYEKVSEQIVNELPLFQSQHVIKISGEDERKGSSTIFIAKEKTNNYGNNKQGRKEQSLACFKKIKEKYDYKDFENNVQIRSHAQGQCYFIELNEYAPELMKQNFIKKTVQLKTEGLAVQSYADYYMQQKSLADSEANSIKKYEQNNM